MNTSEKLFVQIEKTQSIICVGLDPRISVDKDVLPQSQNVFQQIVDHNQKVIDATYKQCACYKPNIAFYEQWGVEGWRALEWTIAYIPSEIPIILDAKRGDIGDTSASYAYSAFAHLNVDSITLAPYMGSESIAPFFTYRDKLLLILSRTSNPKAELLQEQLMQGEQYTQKLYLEVADQFAKRSENIGFVVGANCYEGLAEIRKRYPTRWILAPGIGTQGGDIQQAVIHGIGAKRSYLLPVISRAIANAEAPGDACKMYNKLINQALPHSVSVSNGNVDSNSDAFNEVRKARRHFLAQKIIVQLYEHECIKIGSFVLKSGLTSPFYIDLRRVISFPSLFELVIHAYCDIIALLKFDCIAGIPTAALPFAATVAQALKVPMIYPRISKKQHGINSEIEGAFESGKKVLLLDDLITKGSSKEEALEILQSAHLQVKDIVVLICRSYNAVADMNQLKVNLHYVLHIDEIIDYGVANDYIDETQLAQIREFLRR